MRIDLEFDDDSMISRCMNSHEGSVDCELESKLDLGLAIEAT